MGAPKEQTVTNKSEPWKEAKPYYKDLYNKAQEAFGATNKESYQGDMWAAPNETQQAANRGMAANVWDTGATDLRQLGTDTVSGKYLDPSTNPWLKGSVDAALSDVTNKYTRDVLPRLGSAAIQGGAYGGGRQGITEGLAAGEYSREANEAATGIYASNYQTERDRQLRGGDLFNQANALEMAHLEGLAGAGEQQQTWEQGQLAEDYNRWQMEQAAPWAGIPELLSVLTGGGFQSTSATGPNPNYTNPTQTAMGLGSMLTGLYDVYKG